jgi:hypothetical protein
MKLTGHLHSSHPGGYRVDKQTVPFDGQKSLFKCMKCDGGFGSEEEKTEHENSRQCCSCLPLCMNPRTFTKVSTRFGGICQMLALSEDFQ